MNSNRYHEGANIYTTLAEGYSLTHKLDTGDGSVVGGVVLHALTYSVMAGSKWVWAFRPPRLPYSPARNLGFYLPTDFLSHLPSFESGHL